MIGMPGIVATDPRRFAQSIFNAVLGGGMSSRLFQEIREKRGLVYSVFSFASSYSDAGISGFYAGTSPNKAPEVTKLMMDEFLRVVDSGITRDELARAQGQIAGASALALEDTDTRMSRLGRSEIATGEFNDYDTMLEQLNAVTVADVRDLATEFASGALSLISVGAADDDALRAAIQRSA
jgi:predicted Zn-dependent peptidase